MTTAGASLQNQATAILSASALICCLLDPQPMIGENRQLVTNEPVEFEK
jgi:hypothetical protein